MPSRFARALAILFNVSMLVSAAFASERPPLSEERIRSLQERFGSVKSWHISFRYSGDNPHQWEESGTQHLRTRWAERSQGSFVMPTTENDPLQVRIYGKAPSYDSMDYYRVSRSSPVHEETRYDRGEGATTADVDITFDFETGTYDLSFIANEIPDSYGGTMKDAFETRRYANVATTHVIMPIPAPADITLRLPEEGTTITGSWSHEQEMAAKRRADSSFDESEYAQKQPTRGQLTWTIRPAEIEPLDVELIVEPQGYDAWMPEAGASEKAAGNQIAIKATLVAKDGGPLKRRATQITFSLAEVSREKGIALNAPLEHASDAPDLAFEAAKNPSANVGGDGQSVRFASGPYESVTANLSSFDWGAFGTVIVVARLDNGRTVHGHLRGAAIPDVLIPKRTGGGVIADAWKRMMNFAGSDGEDEDAQPGNNNLGDGLTAYEEYRGLIIGGRHSRATRLLEPTKKDLIVINEIGERAVKGLRLFESAAGIHVVEAKTTDFTDSRQVNLNRGHASGGAQFGERLKTAVLEDTAGENRPAAELNKTPKKSQEAVVDVALAEKFYNEQLAVLTAAGEKMPYTLEEDIAQTIAHELAHGVGAPHHRKTSEYFGRREVVAKMVDWKVFGINGRRVAVTESNPVKLTGQIGRPGNDASGDIGCIMAYANFYQWAAVGREGGPYTFYAVPPQPVGTRFCTSSAGTGYNEKRTLPDGTPMPAFFGNARGQGSNSPVGNCLGAMRVRDW